MVRWEGEDMSADELHNKDIDDVLRLVKNIYHTIVYINLTDNSFRCVQSNPPDIQRLLAKSENYERMAAGAVEAGMVYAEDAQEFASFLDRSQLRAQLAGGKEYLSITYRRSKGGRYRWEMMEIIPSKDYRADRQVVLLCARDIDEEHQRELDKEAKLSVKERQLVGEKTVLVVDDSDLQRTTLCYFLEQHYRTIEKENGFEALEYLKNHSTDISVILMDLNMPVMNGYEFLQEFQKDEIMRMIPVLVLTSDNTPEEEAGCLRAGATDFVAKPFNPDVLLSRIQRAIALHEKTVMLNVLRMDNLTNCYTRDYFLHMAEQLLARYPEEDFDLVCTHVVNLPNINEQYGARQGEAILRYVAQNQERQECERSVYGRLDDATFARLLPHSAGSYQKLLQQSDGPHEYKTVKEGLPPFVQKYGVYESVDHSIPVSVMCDRAMMALQKILHNYNQLINLYDDNIRLYALKTQRILENMEEAIDQHQFQVWYQPKHNIFDGSLIGAEALVRWIHPRYGFMSPGEFIPIFEENGFVAHVDRYVWEEACAAIRRWRDMGLRTVPVSVNISRKDFLCFHDKEMLKPLLAKYALEPADLHIEVTESAYMDNPDMVIRKVNEMHSDGFVVELDDFGSGYSSLSMFGHMDIDVVKLDMSFIRQEQNEQSDKMMHHIIDMCKNMGLAVLSEGVETEEQRQRLMGMGCDYVQGYYYSKPLPEGDFVEYLRKRS
ncbi:MAG: EAL domain-containing protein [Selenomonadaceae bacterium]|nr:EAL domain-containing protein [Selenomonadaceae bacterium]